MVVRHAAPRGFAAGDRLVSGQWSFEDLRIIDAGGTDFVTFSHDGTDLNFVGTNTSEVNATSGITRWNLPIVSLNRIELGDSEYISMESGGDARVYARKVSIADDGTATFATGTVGIGLLVTNLNSTAMALFAFRTSATQTIADLGSGANVAMGTTNPDIDTDVNIWTSSATELSIKNRLGSTRVFTLYLFGP